MTYKTHTYRVYPNSGGLWKGTPWQRGQGVGGRWSSVPWQRGEGRGGLWKARVLQRGDGWGSFFGRMARKILPAATKGIKAIKNSKTLREVGKTLLDTGMAGVTEIAANAIEGTTDGKSASETAQERLDAARRDIAKIIRKKGNGNADVDSDTDESVADYSLERLPVVKRKRPKVKSPKRKKYNVLKNIKNGK